MKIVEVKEVVLDSWNWEREGINNFFPFWGGELGERGQGGGNRLRLGLKLILSLLKHGLAYVDA